MRNDTSPDNNLLSDIEAHLKATGMAASYFGWLACKNTDLVARLKNGGRVWPETEAKVRSFMKSRSEPAE